MNESAVSRLELIRKVGVLLLGIWVLTNLIFATLTFVPALETHPLVTNYARPIELSSVVPLVYFIYLVPKTVRAGFRGDWLWFLLILSPISLPVFWWRKIWRFTPQQLLGDYDPNSRAERTRRIIAVVILFPILIYLMYELIVG